MVGFAAGRGFDVGIILEMYAGKRNEFDGISAPKTLGYFEDHARVGDMYARVLKVEPFSLSESIISELMDLDFSTIISMHCDGMDGPAAKKRGEGSGKRMVFRTAGQTDLFQ